MMHFLEMQSLERTPSLMVFDCHSLLRRDVMWKRYFEL